MSFAAKKDEKIVIIGAGAAGISIANALRERGHTKLTVLEKQRYAGGKCKTIISDGLSMDIGAVYVLPNYPNITRLAQKMGLRLRKGLPFEHLAGDGTYRGFGFPQPSVGSKALEYLRLGIELIKNHPALYQPIGEWDMTTTRNLAEPFGTWMEKHQLKYFRNAAYPLLRSFGFGYESQQIPAGYIVNTFTKLARGGNLLSLWNIPAINLHHLEEGYGELWKRAAAALDMRYDTQITSVERSNHGGIIRTEQGEIEFDQLIIACQLPAALSFLDVSAEEKELFSKIRSFDVWQIAVKAEGLHDAVIIDKNQESSSMGKTMILFRYKPASDWYYLFGYDRKDPPQTDAEILTSAEDTIKKMGGKIQGDLHLMRWSGYFPHYSSTEFASGYHSHLNALQGLRSTFYVGEIFANIGVEATMAYSERIAAKYFG